MRVMPKRLSGWAVLLAFVLPSTACVAAAAAGAAGAIYATTRGVESLVSVPVDQVATRVPPVMDKLGIVQTGKSTEDTGAKREFKGTHGDLDVSIQLERQDSAMTKIEVSARKNVAEWDKDFARTVLEEILQQR
jgi:hypothetical protein